MKIKNLSSSGFVSMLTLAILAISLFSLGPLVTSRISQLKSDTPVRNQPSSVSRIASEDYYVQPILFFPTDYPVDSAVVQRASVVMNEIKSYYSSKFGKTFNMKSTEVISGDHTAKWYWCKDGESGCNPGDAEGNVIRQISAKGISIEPSPPNVIYSIVVMGGGGWAGTSGEMGAVRGLRTLIGDLSIYPELDGNCNRVKQYYFKGDPIDSLARCRNENMPRTRQGSGAWAHELGHAFGLPHPNDAGYPTSSPEYRNSIMGNQTIFPGGSFNPKEKELLAKSPYFGGSAGTTPAPTNTPPIGTSPTPTNTPPGKNYTVPGTPGYCAGGNRANANPQWYKTGENPTCNFADTKYPLPGTPSIENDDGYCNTKFPGTGYFYNCASSGGGSGSKVICKDQGGIDASVYPNGYYAPLCLSQFPTQATYKDGLFSSAKAILKPNPYAAGKNYDSYLCMDKTYYFTPASGITGVCDKYPWVQDSSGRLPTSPPGHSCSPPTPYWDGSKCTYRPDACNVIGPSGKQNTCQRSACGAGLNPDTRASQEEANLACKEYFADGRDFCCLVSSAGITPGAPIATPTSSAPLPPPGHSCNPPRSYWDGSKCTYRPDACNVIGPSGKENKCQTSPCAAGLNPDTGASQEEANLACKEYHADGRDFCCLASSPGTPIATPTSPAGSGTGTEYDHCYHGDSDCASQYRCNNPRGSATSYCIYRDPSEPGAYCNLSSYHCEGDASNPSGHTRCDTGSLAPVRGDSYACQRSRRGSLCCTGASTSSLTTSSSVASSGTETTINSCTTNSQCKELKLTSCVFTNNPNVGVCK